MVKRCQKMKFMHVVKLLISALVIAFVQQSLQDDDNTIPLAVVINRRLSGDIQYSDYPDKFSACIDRKSSNFTYLVEERLCVTSSDLQEECSSLIIPNKTSNLIAVASASSSTSTLVIDAGASGGAMFYFRDTEQLINRSVCAIDSLEVYRGREQAIKISHHGFTLSNGGAFEINYNETTYSRDEYEGELYRMNLSCSGEGLPESGCLFFKVRGIANITNAKFNCIVPGTLTDFNKECKFTPTTNTISATTSPSTTLNTTTTFNTTTNSLSPTELLIALVIVGGVTVLISAVMVCVMILFRNYQKGSKVNVVAQPPNQDSEAGAMKSQPGHFQRNPAYGHFSPTDSSPAALVSGSCSENPAYNIDAQPSAPQETTYEVIPSDTDRIPQNVICSQNPAYSHLGVQEEESFQAAPDTTSPGDYSQNPAYGIHSSPV